MPSALAEPKPVEAPGPLFAPMERLSKVHAVKVVAALRPETAVNNTVTAQAMFFILILFFVFFSSIKSASHYPI
jgi:hypothetical protein